MYTNNKRPVVIALTGKAGHGKDTVGRFFAAALEGSPFINVKFLSFAKPLKDVAKLVFNLSDSDVYTEEGKNKYLPEYNMTVRTLLQIIGTEMFRDMVHEDIWLHCLQRKLEEEYQEDPHSVFIITDTRFPNEADFLRRIGDTVLIEVERPGMAIQESGHSSEAGAGTPDIRIKNDGSLEDLRELVNEAITYLPDLLTPQTEDL